jgi:hypothetical protein
VDLTFKICVEITSDKTINVECAGNKEICELLQILLLTTTKIHEIISKISKQSDIIE